MSNRRRVVGHPTDEPGCIAALACAVADEARSFGFKVGRPRVSRSRSRSRSRYLTVTDRQDRAWHIRVSDHYRPARSNYAPPHFDLVSLDGTAGLNEARRFLNDVIEGNIAWSDLSSEGHRPRRKRRANPKRWQHGRTNA